jgi:hypothetical protein
MREGFQVFLFVVGNLSILMCFYNYIGWKVHRSKSRILTLPASTIEKFVEMMFVGFILLCVYLLIYTSILGISHLISGESIWFLSDFLKANLTQLRIVTGIVLFVSTFLLMCYFTFRRFPFGAGALFLISYASIISYTAYIFYKIEDYDFNNFNFLNGFLQSNAWLETMSFLNTYNTLGMCIASVVLLYISYLKLKEKQIR